MSTATGAATPRRSARIGSVEASVRRARRVARLLDDAVRVPGTDFRIGLDPILSVLPVAGDTVGLAISLYVVLEAINARAPPSLLARMVAVIVVDATVGSIPVLGTLFDAVWKANTWNVAALERHVRDRRPRPT